MTSSTRSYRRSWPERAGSATRIRPNPQPCGSTPGEKVGFTFPRPRACSASSAGVSRLFRLRQTSRSAGEPPRRWSPARHRCVPTRRPSSAPRPQHRAPAAQPLPWQRLQGAAVRSRPRCHRSLRRAQGIRSDPPVRRHGAGCRRCSVALPLAPARQEANASGHRVDDHRTWVPLNHADLEQCAGSPGTDEHRYAVIHRDGTNGIPDRVHDVVGPKPVPERGCGDDRLIHVTLQVMLSPVTKGSIAVSVSSQHRAMSRAHVARRRSRRSQASANHPVTASVKTTS